MRRERPGARALLALAAALLSAAPAGARDYTPGQERYVEGVRAFDRGDYPSAAAAMRAALAEDPTEAAARFRYKGLNREDYFPHLYLGLSLEKLGQTAPARASLRESRRQGAVAARPALDRLLDAALLRLEPPPEPPTPTTPARPAPAATLPPAAPTPSATEPAVPSPALPATRQAAPPPPPPVRAGPEGVRSGIRAFFQADYASAEVLLSPEAPGRPVARLFLAYALAGRFLLGGEGDQALLARARAEHARALADGARESGRFVSPAVLRVLSARR